MFRLVKRLKTDSEEDVQEEVMESCVFVRRKEVMSGMIYGKDHE